MVKVYVAMSADIIHQGHINIIKKAAEYGDVVIGLLTDEAIASYKRVPLISYENRLLIFKELRDVSDIVPQNTLNYTDNLMKIKPKYVVHGDDWRTGNQKIIRNNVIETLKKWGGELIEVPYTKDVSCSALERNARFAFNTPDIRRAKLRELLRCDRPVIVCEASNGLSGLIVENTKDMDSMTGLPREFDGMWVSSLCDSSFKGKPDTELVDFTSRLKTIEEIMEVTTKPIILDGDTGGKTEHFVYNVKTLERIGVSAIIVEDKIGSKRNSLFGTDVEQTLDDPHEFAIKIAAGKKAQVTRDFMIFCRIEALIAGKGIKEAINRSIIYLKEGMCDGICIHSKNKDGREIKQFLNEFKKIANDVPIILIPTTYNQFTDEDLYEWGAKIIIYANHMLRSAYPAMKNTAECILKNHRSKEASEKYCISVKDVLSIIPGEK